ncbi:MAG: EamA family transporter [Salinirussus sp.]
MLTAEVLALVAAFSLGAGTVVMKHGLRSASRELFVFVSLGVQAVLFSTLAIITGLTFLGLWIAAAAFVASGLLGSILARYASAFAVDRVGVALAFPIRSTAPLFSAIVAVLILGETVTPLLAGGTAIVVAGVAILSHQAYSDDRATTANTTSATNLVGRRRLLSLAPALVSAILFGITPTLRKFGLEAGVSVTDGLALTFVAAFLVYGPYFLTTRRDELASSGARRDVRWFVVTGLLWSAALGTYFLALSLADTVVVVPLFYTSPLFAIGLSYVFLRDLEVVSAGVLVGAACVTLGTAIVVIG